MKTFSTELELVQMMEFVFDGLEKNFWGRRKQRSQNQSSSQNVFLKFFFVKVSNSWDCVVKD